MKKLLTTYHALHTRRKTHSHFSGGFTLVETLVAVFILVVAVTALMTVAKNDFYVVRYARNQMIANTLMQEALEYVRNSRDTALQNGTSWSDWLATYDVCGDDTSGCIVDPYRLSGNHISSCNDACPAITYYPEQLLYAYGNGKNIDYGSIDPDGAYKTAFTRWITVRPVLDGANPVQAIITSHITWYNGNNADHLVTQTQSTVVSDWNPN
jgi:Tfp pilus assembly protein PilV